MDDTITGISVTDTSIFNDATKNFTITFASLGITACVMVDYDDEKGVDIFSNNVSFCNSRLTSPMRLKPLTNPLFVSRMFTIEKSYIMKIIGLDLFGDVVKKFDFAVSTANCASPQLSIFNQALQFYNAKQVYKSTAIQLTASVYFDCPDIINNFKLWRIFTVDPLIGTDMSEIDISQLDSSKFPELFFPARFLSYGLYHLNFSMTLLVRSATGRLMNFTAATDTYLHVRDQLASK